MTTMARDTDPRAEAAQLELLRQASVPRRFGLVRSLTDTTVRLARRAIRRARPEAGEAEVMLTFVALSYGPELAERLRRHLGQTTQ